MLHSGQLHERVEDLTKNCSGIQLAPLPESHHCSQLIPLSVPLLVHVNTFGLPQLPVKTPDSG